MRLSNVVRLYRVRLRSRVVQEVFAIVGIAVGVALLFGSQVASTSLNGSVERLTNGIAGQIQLQLVARDPHGFDERLLGDVQHLPGIRTAVPGIEERVNVIGPSGQQSVDLFGADPRFARLGGPLIRRFRYVRLSRLQALALPSSIARAIGAVSLQPIRLQVGTRVVRAFFGVELSGREIGALADSPIAVAPLVYAQRLTNMAGRITRIFVQTVPGQERQARRELTRVAGGRLNVTAAGLDATLFRQAAGPTNKSTSLFSAISALVGFLFAFNAMLLTARQRRNLVEDLRLDGYTAWMIVRVLLFDGLVLGVLASLLGLMLGELFSIALFNASPGYLSFGFVVGSQRIVTWQSIAVATAGGLLAACIGVLAPLRREIWLPLAVAFSTPARSVRKTNVALAGGLACLAFTTLILLMAPRAAVLGALSLVMALLLFLPVLLAGAVSVFDRLQRPITSVSPRLAVIELRSRSNRGRSLAVAATGAIAVFGSVAVQGAHADLQRGLDRLFGDVTSVTDLWVVPPGTQNLLATTSFPAGVASSLARLPGVQTVGEYRAGLLDYEDRRVWVLAPPKSAAHPVPPSQLVSGNLALAAARLRTGGWAVLSRVIAVQHHLRIGQSFTLPSPRPAIFRVAALTTNLGWPPGAIIVNPDDYARAWGSTDVSAYNVKVAPGARSGVVRGEIGRALGSASGLVVETARQREQRQRTASHEGLERLTQISTLVLIAAVLAMAATMGAMIWQRRPQVADMKVDGFSRGVLWRALVLESVLLLGTGCSIGAVFGIYGQLLLSHALAAVTGFPIVFSISPLIAVGSFVLVTAVAAAIVAVPGYLAARVRPMISLQD